MTWLPAVRNAIILFEIIFELFSPHAPCLCGVFARDAEYDFNTDILT